MTDYKTMRVPKDDWEKAKAAKRDTETWGEFLQRCSNTPPEIREYVEQDTEALAAEIKAEIDSLAFDGALTDDEAERLINSVGTIEERLGKVEQMVERLGGTQ